jgi:exopolysaccharide biosynthesis predicted pyruvyltransferase EpsI
MRSPFDFAKVFGSGLSVPGVVPGGLCGSLSQTIATVLESLLPRGAPCALLGAPYYLNVSDNAIWLGQRRALRTAGVRIVYTCGPSTYVREQLVRHLQGGTILLQGGASLGDLWPEHQSFREQVIAAFPDHPIIQLPQTICFQQPSALARARAVFNSHPNLTLLVRDHRSLELARNEFKASSLLCPDMAFALGAMKRPRQACTEVLWLSRTDKEASRGSPDVRSASYERADWLGENPASLTARTRILISRMTRDSTALGPTKKYVLPLYDLLAGRRLAYGCQLLSRGKVVVTDRLHGHILSLLLGIPHLLLDDRYGKLKSFYETWTAASGLATWADSPAEALQWAAARARAMG